MKRPILALIFSCITAITAFLALGLLLHGWQPAYAAVIVVNADDLTNGSGDCSLREAIAAANTNSAVDGCTAGSPGMDTISIPAGSFTVNSGELAVTEDLILSGAGAGSSSIDGGGVNRLLHVSGGSVVTVTQLTLTNGQAVNGGAVFVDTGSVALVDGRITASSAEKGGGVYVNQAGAQFRLLSGEIDNNVVTNTTTSSEGAGIYVNLGSFTMDGGVIHHNIAQDLTSANLNYFPGGGVHISKGDGYLNGGRIEYNNAYRGGGVLLRDGAGSLQINGTQIISNTALRYGGGLYIYDGSVNFDSGEIAYNEAQFNENYGGGGMYQFRGTFTMNGGAIRNNTSAFNGGGMIIASGTAVINNATLSGNSAANGGGAVQLLNANGNLTVNNSTISGNTPAAVWVANGTAVIAGNIISDHATVFDIGIGSLTAYANNITSFTLGINGAETSARNNWWGAINPAGVGSSDALAYRLGAEILSWSQSGALADSGGGSAALTASSGSGTPVIVNHGRSAANQPFGVGVGAAADLCSDHYDFFVVDGSGGATFDLTVPVDDNPACNSSAAGGTPQSNILLQFALAGSAPDDSCGSPDACWELYGGTINRGGGGPYTLTAVDVPLTVLSGTPYAAGAKTNYLTIADAVVAEGADAAIFTVTLSNPSDGAVTVDYATADGTAVAGSDYTAAAGQLSFPLNTTQQTITVTVDEDNLDESTEVFYVNLSDPAGANLSDGQAAGTITDNDPAPTLQIADSSITEGDAGSQAATFTVTLSAASAQTVTVAYATADDTATQPADYIVAAGTLTFTPGVITHTIGVTVVGDTINEGAGEQFLINLSAPVNVQLPDTQATGTIIDDDVTIPAISITPISVSESAGTATFTVTLSAASDGGTQVDYTTVDESAVSSPAGDKDFESSSGTLTFPQGTISRPITITIYDDARVEGDETFRIQLSNPQQGTLATSEAAGTIADNDAAQTHYLIFLPLLTRDTP